MGKTSLVRVAAAYLSTLRSYRTEKYMASDIAVQLVAPALLGAAFGVTWPVPAARLSEAVGNMVSGVSIISALLCGVAVMVFQLRLQLASQESPRPTKREVVLVDETFHDILWAVVAGFASVILLTISGMLPDDGAAQRTVVGVAVFFLLNFLLVTCMCIKRLHSAYEIVSKYWIPRE